MKIGITIKKLNSYLMKNHKTLKLKKGLICGFSNDLMSFEGKGQAKRLKKVKK